MDIKKIAITALAVGISLFAICALMIAATQEPQYVCVD